MDAQPVSIDHIPPLVRLAIAREAGGVADDDQDAFNIALAGYQSGPWRGWKERAEALAVEAAKTPGGLYRAVMRGIAMNTALASNVFPSSEEIAAMDPSSPGPSVADGNSAPDSHTDTAAETLPAG